MSGHTTGVWIPEDSDLLARLDAAFGPGERSSAFRDGAELQLAVHETLAREEVSIPRGPDQRAFVTQAVRNELRREADD